MTSFIKTKQGNDGVVYCTYSNDQFSLSHVYNLGVGLRPKFIKTYDQNPGLSNFKAKFENGNLIFSFRRLKSFAQSLEHPYFDLNHPYYILLARGVATGMSIDLISFVSLY